MYIHLCSPLISKVLRWFLVSNTIGSNGFPMDFGPKPLVAMVFQWFPMVANHWSDNGMVTIHRSGLLTKVDYDETFAANVRTSLLSPSTNFLSCLVRTQLHYYHHLKPQTKFKHLHPTLLREPVKNVLADFAR